MNAMLDPAARVLASKRALSPPPASDGGEA
jgi:hypothetical protein